jgi:hypothetical protein
MKAAAPRAHEKPHHPHWPLAALLFALVFAFAWDGVRDAGTWVRLRTGRAILETGIVPRVDSLSYGSARAAWTTDSWLADAAFAKADALGGPGLVAALTSAAVAAGFALLLPISHGDPLAAAGLLAFAAASGWAGLAPAPAAFDFLFFALFLRLLRPRRRFRWQDGFAATALTVLWTNLHGAVAPLALAFVFLKAFKASLRAAMRESLGYWAMFFACAIAFSWNPLGYGVLSRLFADAPSWISPLVSPAGLLIFLGLGSCAFTLQQEFVTTLACAVVLGLALVAPALRPLGAMAACPVCALALGHFQKPRADTPARVVRWCAPATLILFVVYRALISRPLAPAGGYGAPALDGAVRYLRAEGVSGAMFNEPALGRELIGVSAPPVFVDERPGLYQDSFVAEAADWPRTFRSLDAVYRFDYAVTSNRRAGAPARVLDDDANWRLGYADDRALVYLKRDGADGWLAAKSGFRLVSPNRLWPDALDPVLRPATAAQALDELDRWSLQAPDSVQALLWKAYALGRLGRAADADRLLALARARPALDWDPQLQAEAAFVLASRGRDDEAHALYKRAARAARRLGDAELARAIDAQAEGAPASGAPR